MYVIRAVCKSDFEALREFAHNRTLGIVNLPRNEEILQRKIDNSLASFAKDVTTPHDESYLFILEEMKTGKKVGVSGIIARIGVEHPQYFYRLEKETDTLIPQEVLRPVEYHNGPTEICALYLCPSYRKGGLGRLLSLCRFMFIAEHPNRFDPTVIAELRGPIIKRKGVQTSPFWQAISQHLSDFTFMELMTHLECDRTFVDKVIAKHPFYVSFLPKEAQKVIGQTHKTTQAALKMLQSEGFTMTLDIDPFDAGPKVAAECDKIRVVADSIKTIVDGVTEKPILASKKLLATTAGPFLCCAVPAEVTPEGGLIIPQEVADNLNIAKGDGIRYVEFYKERE